MKISLINQPNSFRHSKCFEPVFDKMEKIQASP